MKTSNLCFPTESCAAFRQTFQNQINKHSPPYCNISNPKKYLDKCHQRRFYRCRVCKSPEPLRIFCFVLSFVECFAFFLHTRRRRCPRQSRKGIMTRNAVEFHEIAHHKSLIGQ